MEYGGSKGNVSDSDEEDEIFSANDWNGVQQEGGVGEALNSDSESADSDEEDDKDNSQ